MAEGIESIFTMKKRPPPAGKNYLDPESMCIRAREIPFSRCGIVCTTAGKRIPRWMITKVLEVKGIIK